MTNTPKVEWINTTAHAIRLDSGAVLPPAPADVVAGLDYRRRTPPGKVAEIQGIHGVEIMVLDGEETAEPCPAFAPTLVGLVRGALERTAGAVILLASFQLKALPEGIWQQASADIRPVANGRPVIVAAQIFTEETKRAAPQEKIARTDRVSLIARLA